MSSYTMCVDHKNLTVPLCGHCGACLERAREIAARPRCEYCGSLMQRDWIGLGGFRSPDPTKEGWYWRCNKCHAGVCDDCGKSGRMREAYMSDLYDAFSVCLHGCDPGRGSPASAAP